MTTPNERDRFEAWAKDTMSLVKEPGGYKEATTHHAWRAWQAALTREQREGYDAVLCRECGQPTMHVGTLCYACAHKPQPEAPGAVAALVATWREDAEKEDARYEESAGFKCGLQYCATDLEFALRSESATTPPAPVDVRVALPKVTFKNVQRGDCGKYPDGTGWGHAWSAPIVEIERADWDRFIALLDGQQAGVDDEMSRMDAVIAAHKTWPTDLRKKLSLHDLRRMSGWAPKPSPRDWRIDTSAGVPILVYQNCSVIEGEQARYVIGLIEKDGQQGLVIDDAKVRRAVCAYDEWMIEYAPDKTDAYYDGMRAALQAALGGGGGRG